MEGDERAFVFYQQIEDAAVGVGGRNLQYVQVVRAIQFLLGAQVVVGHFQVRFAAADESADIGKCQLGRTLTAFPFFGKGFDVVLLGDRHLRYGEQAFRLLATYADVNDFVFAVDPEERGVGADLVYLAEGDGLGFLHIQFDVDEVGVEEVAYFGYGKDIRAHPFAGATPGSVGVHEDEFALGFRFDQGFLPGAVEEFNPLGGSAQAEGKNEGEKGKFT